VAHLFAKQLNTAQGKTNAWLTAEVKNGRILGGEQSPDFTLTADDGKKVKLSSCGGTRSYSTFIPRRHAGLHQAGLLFRSYIVTKLGMLA